VTTGSIVLTLAMMVMTLHINRPRPKTNRPPLVATLKVTGPYRAEHRKKKTFGMWRENIEDAFRDAKRLGSGAAVVSSERVLLAKFENAAKFLPEESRKEALPRRHKRITQEDDED